LDFGLKFERRLSTHHSSATEPQLQLRFQLQNLPWATATSPQLAQLQKRRLVSQLAGSCGSCETSRTAPVVATGGCKTTIGTTWGDPGGGCNKRTKIVSVASAKYRAESAFKNYSRKCDVFQEDITRILAQIGGN
jgi:hypothetical protein